MGTRRSMLRLSQLITLVSLCVAAPLAGQMAPPGADVVLQRMSSYLAAQETFHLRATLTFDDVPTPGVKVQYSGTMDVFLRRPDRLHVDYRDDLSARQVWLDGETVTLLDPIKRLWAQGESGATVDATLDRLATDHGHSLPLDDLLFEDPYSRLMSGVKAHRNIGLHRVAGADCHHLVFGQEDLTWQLWVDAGDKPLPRKILITYTNLPMAPQFTAVLAGWDLEPRLPDERFEPVIPTDTVRADLVTLGEANP